MRQFALVLIGVGAVLLTGCGDRAEVGPTPPSVSNGPGAPASPPPPAGPAQPAYTVTGRVTDLRGLGISGAEIWIYGNDSPIDNRYGVTFTDAAGYYSVASATRVPHTVRAIKDGYVRREVPIQGSAASSTWIADLSLVHIDRYQLIAPNALATGENARLQARVDLDDGTTQTGFIFLELSSDRPSVLQVQSNAWITGISPGLATITARYYGAVATHQVRVNAAE